MIKKKTRRKATVVKGQILFPFYSFLERGFRLPMTKLVPESTHHVSHANPGVVTPFHGLGKIQISELFSSPITQNTFIGWILNQQKLSLIYSTNRSFLYYSPT